MIGYSTPQAQISCISSDRFCPIHILWFNCFLIWFFLLFKINSQYYNAKNWLIGKDSYAGRDWGQEEKGTTEDEMAGWHHWLDGSEFEWTLGDVMDREAWRAVIRGVAKSRTRLSNWTDWLMIMKLIILVPRKIKFMISITKLSWTTEIYVAYYQWDNHEILGKIIPMWRELEVLVFVWAGHWFRVDFSLWPQFPPGNWRNGVRKFFP